MSVCAEGSHSRLGAEYARAFRSLQVHEQESSEKAALKLNGEPVALAVDKGYVTLDRTWKKGDTIELKLADAHPKSDGP